MFLNYVIFSLYLTILQLSFRNDRLRPPSIDTKSDL